METDLGADDAFLRGGDRFIVGLNFDAIGVGGRVSLVVDFRGSRIGGRFNVVERGLLNEVPVNHVVDEEVREAGES